MINYALIFCELTLEGIYQDFILSIPKRDKLMCCQAKLWIKKKYIL